MSGIRPSNPLRKVELERHKWDAHAKAPGEPKSNTRGSRTHSASAVHAKRALYPSTTRPTAGGAAERYAPTTGSRSCASYRVSHGGSSAGHAAAHDLSQSQTVLYAALFGQQPRQSSPASSPKHAWADEYDAVVTEDRSPGCALASFSDGTPAPTHFDQVRL